MAPVVKPPPVPVVKQTAAPASAVIRINKADLLPPKEGELKEAELQAVAKVNEAKVAQAESNKAAAEVRCCEQAGRSTALARIQAGYSQRTFVLC